MPSTSSSPGSCDACGTSLERCPVDAVVEGGECVEIDPMRCIGCGVCLSTCPREAMSLVEREDAGAPPLDYHEALECISRERGLSWR